MPGLQNSISTWSPSHHLMVLLRVYLQMRYLSTWNLLFLTPGRSRWFCKDLTPLSIPLRNSLNSVKELSSVRIFMTPLTRVRRQTPRLVKKVLALNRVQVKKLLPKGIKSIIASTMALTVLTVLMTASS